jgi:BirA family biotin operon repressor/biotin-[acetyl-CoA-carboxylase] ligase
MKNDAGSGRLSSKALLLAGLRDKQGAPVSGPVLAEKLGVSRVAVWKTVQALTEAGYSIKTSEHGYSLDPQNEKDFLYPWEFGEKEPMFRHYLATDSTMDRARELALRGTPGGTVITAEKQSAGRGRRGRTWISRQGGLFFTILERPGIAVMDYTLISLAMQIAVARVVSSVCGKKAFLRWPNDVYISRRKISGVTTEISGEGDLIAWLSGGVGVNVNNPVPSAKTTSINEITGRQVSRRETLVKIIDEIEKVKKTFASAAVYSQGNPALAAEWNSLADCIGAKAAVFEQDGQSADEFKDRQGRVLARGVFSGIDPAGRCVLQTGDGAGKLYFNQGSVSLAFINAGV